VLQSAYEYMQQHSSDFTGYGALMDAAWTVAAWPEKVARHTLRAGPALLANMLGLRITLRNLQKAG